MKKPVEYWVRPVAGVYSRWVGWWWASRQPAVEGGRPASAHTVLSTLFYKVTHYHTVCPPPFVTKLVCRPTFYAYLYLKV